MGAIRPGARHARRRPVADRRGLHPAEAAIATLSGWVEQGVHVTSDQFKGLGLAEIHRGGRLPCDLRSLSSLSSSLRSSPASAQIQDDLADAAPRCVRLMCWTLTESQYPYTPTFHVGLATWFKGCTYFLPPSVGPILSTMRADIETIHRHRAEGEDVSGRHRTVVCDVAAIYAGGSRRRRRVRRRPITAAACGRNAGVVPRCAASKVGIAEVPSAPRSGVGRSAEPRSPSAAQVDQDQHHGNPLGDGLARPCSTIVAVLAVQHRERSTPGGELHPR